MSSQPGDRARNRQLWTLVNQQFTDADAATRREEEAVTWGLFRIPESDLGLLGDVRGARVAELGCGTAGFVVDALHELYAPEDAPTHEYYDIVTANWAHRWPAEDRWVAHRPG